MKTVKFSVIIPALNEEKYLPKLLESLSMQTVKNFEVIVVDGNSRDKTIKVAEAFHAKLPKLTIINSKQASLPLQRNLGVKKAVGEWLVLVDADTILMPYFMERASLFIEEKNPSAFTTWGKPDSNDANDAAITLLANLSYEWSLIVKRPMTPGQLSLVRHDVFDSIGGYNEEHAFTEDLEFGLRLVKKNASITILRETLYVWSLRRIRSQGALRVVAQYFLSNVATVLFKKPLKHMPGYVMGGQVYNKKNQPAARNVLPDYERQLRKLFKQMFA